MAILSKEASAMGTINSFSQSTIEKIMPLVSKSKALVSTSVSTAMAILDRYPPLKVRYILLCLSSPPFFYQGFCSISCFVFLDPYYLFPWLWNFIWCCDSRSRWNRCCSCSGKLPRSRWILFVLVPGWIFDFRRWAAHFHL